MGPNFTLRALKLFWKKKAREWEWPLPPAGDFSDSISVPRTLGPEVSSRQWDEREGPMT